MQALPWKQGEVDKADSVSPANESCRCCVLAEGNVEKSRERDWEVMLLM